MSLLVYLVVLALAGLFVGAFGRLALPGKDPMSIPQTIAVGLAGSFVAGLLAYAVAGETSGAGLLLSILVATAFVYLIRRRRGGTFTEAAPSARNPRDR